MLTAGSATEADQVIWLDFAARSIEVLRTSVSVPVDRGYLSVPEPIEFPTDDGLTARTRSSTRRRIQTRWTRTGSGRR